MSLTNDEILSYSISLLNEIQIKENKKLNNEKLKEKMKNNKDFSKLHEKYPSLFDMIIEHKEKFEVTKLIHMLGLHKKVDSGSITQHDASVKIGQKYYDEYVKPKID
jgi:phage tail tube protein FII